jgi:hypothetical protein
MADFRVAAAKAFAEPGMTHNDVGHLMIYAVFVISRSTASRILASCRAARLDLPSPLLDSIDTASAVGLRDHRHCAEDLPLCHLARR